MNIQKEVVALKVNLCKLFIEIEEIIFMAEESQETGYIAKGPGVSIYTQAETIEDLKIAVTDAVRCHYGDDKKRIIRLHIVREEIIAV